LDMDAFYPSVEILDHPELKGKPVIVGGGPERGVVSSASYEARVFGVHSAQPTAQAKRLCPDGVFLPPRMKRYQEVSREIFDIFRRVTPLVEPLSIDEAFLDVAGSTRLFGPPEQIARAVKEEVWSKTGLTVSAGVAPSKFVAKIASDMEKPDGLTVVLRGEVTAFLDPLPIGRMWGAGKATQRSLYRLNIRTFRDLRQFPVAVLEQKFGKSGVKMHQLASGIDERDVIPDRDPKSIGHERTFSRDILEDEDARKELLSLAHRAAHRMRAHRVCGKTVTLKVKYSDFSQITRSTTLAAPTDDGLKIYAELLTLLKSTEVGRRPVRLLGVSLSQLDLSASQEQLLLFNENAVLEKRQRLNAALDSLQEKHGEKCVEPGALIKPHQTPR
jgi:DNA polymerase IV